MPSKHFCLIISFDNKQADRAGSQGQAEVGDARRILSEMRDVQKSILRLGPSPGDAEQQQQHPHSKSKQLSAFSFQLWHGGSFGGFISIRAHLHPEWQSSILPGALQRKGCSHIDNKQEGWGCWVGGEQMNILWILGDFSVHFVCFCHIHSFMETTFRSCHLVGLLGTNQLTELPLGWSQCRCLHLKIKHQGQSS